MSWGCNGVIFVRAPLCAQRSPDKPHPPFVEDSTYQHVVVNLCFTIVFYATIMIIIT